jgi:metal-dependent amidase/aminoacylase/carboxypeptidase family protein
MISPQEDSMDAVRELVKKSREQVIAIRRELHRIPETGFNEAKTSGYVADCLKRLGLEVQTGIATHGMVGLLRTGKPGNPQCRHAGGRMATRLGSPDSGCARDLP